MDHDAAPPPGPGDRVLRAMTDDGAFRVVVTATAATVRGAIAAQGATGATAGLFADLLTSAVLYRHTMAPDLRVQSILRSASGKGTLIADSHPSGATRGLVQLAGTPGIELGAGALLRILRTLQNGELSQGVVELGAGDGVTQGMMSFMHTSEQVDTMLAVGHLTRAAPGGGAPAVSREPGGPSAAWAQLPREPSSPPATSAQGHVAGQDEVVAAGGYLVQLLPGVGRGPLMIMTERLADFPGVAHHLGQPGFSPEVLLRELLHGMAYTLLGEAEVTWSCWCSDLRLISALSTLPRADVEHLIAGGEVLDITCDYCRKEYRIPPGQLRGLVESS